jgi:hypothetical protein
LPKNRALASLLIDGAVADPDVKYQPIQSAKKNDAITTPPAQSKETVSFGPFGGIGHNLPPEAPDAFAEAIIAVAADA